MQKGFVQFIVLGVTALVLVGAGALYLGKDSLFVAQLRYSPTVRSIKTAFLTKGSAEYCQQFGPGDCPEQYCELSGPSCPMCLNIGGCVSKKPAPVPVATPSPSLLPNVTENNETLTPETAKQILPLDETANWKTYTSSKYSFSIKYPADWNVKESSPAVNFSPFSTIGPDSPRAISVEVVDTSIAPPLPAVPRYKILRAISLGTEKVDVLQPNGPAGELYLVKKRIGKYDFGFYFGLNLDRKYDSVFDRMLASFTFLQ